MPLALMIGGTLGVTGGTSTTFTENGKVITSGKSYSDFSVADYRVRPTLEFKSRLPQLQNGVYTKAKYAVQYIVPFICADGSTTFNVFRGEVEVHPEFPAANALALRHNGGQALIDTDVANFWLGGALTF